MAVRVKCSCGKSFQVPSKYAGRRIACANCGQAFTIPKERFTLPPASAIAAPFDAPPESAPTNPPPPERKDTEPAPLELDAAISDLSGLLLEEASAQAKELDLLGDAARDPVPVPAVPGGAPAALSYARDAAARGKELDVIQEPSRSFWADAYQSLVYPVLNASNVITFVVIALVSAARIVLSYAGTFGLLGILIIFGWICAVYLNVVRETAVGSEDLPGIKMEEGVFEDILKPAVKFIGSFGIAFLPFSTYMIALTAGVLPGFLESALALLAWLALGVFLWPVVLMLISFGALRSLFRVDLIFVTVFRTLGPYLAIWLLLLLAGVTWLLPMVAAVAESAELDIYIPTLSGEGLLYSLGMNVLDVYLTIVSMRLIGLYYLHFKRRFALELE